MEMDVFQNTQLRRFGHLASRIFNRPLLINPKKAEVIMGVLASRLDITQMIRVNGDLILPPEMGVFDQELENESRTGGSYETAGYDVEQGVAIIDIEGTLVQKNYCLRPSSGMIGYDGIRQNFIRAMGDEGVRAICLLIDSPGGEVPGCFDLVDTIAAARGDKLIWAILNEQADSGGYAIASAADYITVPRTGETGSIGVVWAHYDFSDANQKLGVKVTFVQRGRRKTDGSGDLPLAPEAQERFQHDVDLIGELFEETVARNRGLSTAAIRDMEAATFLGAEGVNLGLADAVMAPDAAFNALLEELG